MEPFHKRLVAERSALSKRMEKLHVFLERPGASALVGEAQHRLMIRQYDSMVLYRDLLDRRLVLLGSS